MPERLALERVLPLNPGATLPCEPGGVLADLTQGDANAARAWAVEILRESAGRGGPVPLVRVHPLYSTAIADDLAAVMPARPGAIVLTEGVGAHDLLHLAAKLAVAEAEAGIRDGATRIVLQVDTPAGVLALPTLPGASPRLAALAWLPNALARSLGCGTDAEPVAHARGQMLLSAAAARVPALDWSAGRVGPTEADGFAGWLHAPVGARESLRRPGHRPSDGAGRSGSRV